MTDCVKESGDFYYKLDFIKTVLCVLDESQIDEILLMLSKRYVVFKKENTAKYYLENKKIND